MFPWLTVLALLPAVGALALIVVRGAGAKLLALVVSLVAFVISVVLLIAYTPGAGMQFSEQAAWIKPLGVYYALGLDGIGITLVLLVTDRHPAGDHRQLERLRRRGTAGSGAASRRAAWIASGNQPAPAQVRQPGLLRPGVGRREQCTVPVPGHRRVPLLRLLRSHPDPDVLPDRRLRRGSAQLCRGEVPDLRSARRLRHAGQCHRVVRAVRPGREPELPARRSEPAGHRHRHRPLALPRLHVRLRDQGAAGAAAHLAAGCG